MACPEVQPPAQRVPKPTKKPPKTMKMKPLRVNKFWKLNKSVGNNPEKSVMPRAANSCCVCGLMMIALGFESKELPINPPKMIPATKKRFHDSFFQSYLKKLILAGIQAAQTCRSEEEIPKVLFPRINKSGTVKPIKSPEIDQCQGWRIISNVFIMN